MSERTALVTGAARGLGLAVAKALAAQGCNLFLVDVLAPELEAVCDAFRKAGTGCEMSATDISRRDNCHAAVASAVAAFGRLDVVCNVAGIVGMKPTIDVTEAEYNRIMAVNAAGAFWFCQAAIPHLLSTGGNIVNVASQAGVTGSAYLAPYSASKAAVIQMTKSMAVEFNDQPIRINVVCPGGMATTMGSEPSHEGLDMAKVTRLMSPRGLSEPKEVAALIAFVASPAGSAIHGAVLIADNGVAAG